MRDRKPNKSYVGMDVSKESSDINYSPTPTKRMDKTKWKKPDETAKIQNRNKGMKEKNYIYPQKL